MKGPKWQSDLMQAIIDYEEIKNQAKSSTQAIKDFIIESKKLDRDLYPHILSFERNSDEPDVYVMRAKNGGTELEELEVTWKTFSQRVSKIYSFIKKNA